jgi:hypothetical protein
MKPSTPSSPPSSPYAALGIAGQMGCLMFAMVIGALLVGVWVDRTFNTNRLAILICVIGSIPITLTTAMLLTQRIVQRMFPQSVLSAEKKQDTRDEGPQP